jgi:hypothetical protein
MTVSRSPLVESKAMSDLTPEEREALKIRMVELKARMDELRTNVTAARLAEWAELFAKREAIKKQLADEDD